VGETQFEDKLVSSGIKYIAGVDEVGRGCLAGPVLAAAVILPYPCRVEGIKDSKKLTPKKREELEEIIKREAISVGYGIVSPQEIDRINILEASLKAMKIAIEALHIPPEYVLVDGAQEVRIDLPQIAIPKGDSRSMSVAAASILAKVKRDNMMCELGNDYPGFSFSIHKGYGTAKHLAEIREKGPSNIHRMTFKGVR